MCYPAVHRRDEERALHPHYCAIGRITFRTKGKSRNAMSGSSGLSRSREKGWERAAFPRCAVMACKIHVPVFLGPWRHRVSTSANIRPKAIGVTHI